MRALFLLTFIGAFAGATTGACIVMAVMKAWYGPPRNIKKSAINGISLLSKKEYEARRDSIPLADGWWWLRSPGCYSDYVAYINEDGSVNDLGFPVFYSKCFVRPVLWLNQGSAHLKISEKFRFGDKTWTYIGDGFAIADEPFCKMAFRKDANAEDANSYEASDVKKYLDAWLDDQRQKE